ncbi:MAG: EamA family transporter [Chloroflexi bacterium]|nr:EamA family transporter [Chloroflexota bacterium]
MLLALLAATAWAASAIFTRLALESGMKPAQGALVSLLSSFAVVAVLALALDFRTLLAVPLATVVWFAMVGVLNFPLGRLFNFLSAARLGVARSTPVLGASPLFAMLLGAFFLAEYPNLYVLSGALLILVGISVIMSERG